MQQWRFFLRRMGFIRLAIKPEGVCYLTDVKLEDGTRYRMNNWPEFHWIVKCQKVGESCSYGGLFENMVLPNSSLMV